MAGSPGLCVCGRGAGEPPGASSPLGLFLPHQSLCGCWHVASRPREGTRQLASPWHCAPTRASPGNHVDSTGSTLSSPRPVTAMGSPPLWPGPTPQPGGRCQAAGPAPRFLITHAQPLLGAVPAGRAGRCRPGGRGGTRTRLPWETAPPSPTSGLSPGAACRGVHPTVCPTVCVLVSVCERRMDAHVYMCVVSCVCIAVCIWCILCLCIVLMCIYMYECVLYVLACVHMCVSVCIRMRGGPVGSWP